jgi:ribosome-associated heat shock protein Hsp15
VEVLPLRLDLFLDTVCLFKTRSAAAKALRGGQVAIGGHPAKASHAVRPGETIEVTAGTRNR